MMMNTETPTVGLIAWDRLEMAASVMRVLSHPHRLRICELLLRDRFSVNKLAEQLELPHNAVSQHLNMMKAHGLLAREREGKSVYYRVIDPRPTWLLECIRNHGPEDENMKTKNKESAR